LLDEYFLKVVGLSGKRKQLNCRNFL